MSSALTKRIVFTAEPRDRPYELRDARSPSGRVRGCAQLTFPHSACLSVESLRAGPPTFWWPPFPLRHDHCPWSPHAIAASATYEALLPVRVIPACVASSPAGHLEDRTGGPLTECAKSAILGGHHWGKVWLRPSGSSGSPLLPHTKHYQSPCALNLTSNMRAAVHELAPATAMHGGHV